MTPKETSPVPAGHGETPSESVPTWLTLGVGILVLLIATGGILLFYAGDPAAPTEVTEAPATETETAPEPKRERVMLINGEKVYAEDQAPKEEQQPITQAEGEERVREEPSPQENELEDDLFGSSTQKPSSGESAPDGTYEINGSVTERSEAEQFVRVYDYERSAVYTVFLEQTSTSVSDIQIGRQIRVTTNNDPQTNFDVVASAVYMADDEEN